MRARQRVVVGHHGTKKEAASGIFESGFKIKNNEYDWLGHGVYFFEEAPYRAQRWAEDHFPPPEACVVAAEIDLSENCWDFGDISGTGLLEEFFAMYQRDYGEDHLGGLKENEGNRELTCKVINFACKRLSESGRPVCTVRAPFEEGEPVYVHPAGNPTSEMRKMSHVQVAVRDCRVIRNRWLEDKLATKG